MSSRPLLDREVPIPVEHFRRRRSALLRGMTRLVDLGGLFDRERDEDRATGSDLEALAADWHAIGDDMRHAIARAERETGVSADRALAAVGTD